MLDQLDQMQVSALVPTFDPLLPALLEHPDFQEGLHDGQQTFQEGVFWEDHEKVWTEDEIIQFLAEELSEEVYQREQRIARAMGHLSLSYLHHLGFAISYLDQALANREAGALSC